MTDPDRPLEGFTIGITADRRWEEQADLFRKRGADIVHGPTVRTVDVPDDAGLRQATESLLERPPDVLVATTGMGIRKWFEHAAGWGLDAKLHDALAPGQAVARGPKSSMALKNAGLEVAWSADTEQLAEILDRLTAEGVDRKRVALQLHGADLPEAVDRLEQAGADVVDVPVYRWSLPLDPEPALALVDAAVTAELAAVTFTAAPAVHNLFSLAASAGKAADLRQAFAGPVVCACIGPVCAEAAVEEGVAEPLEPERARLSFLARAVTERLAVP